MVPDSVDGRVASASERIGTTASIDGVAAGTVVAPTSTDEVAAVLREAAAEQQTVVVQGAGTKLTWGLPPRSADVLLDLSGLDQVVEHAAGDLIATAQAGTPLTVLQAHVGGAGQRLLLDETVPGTTVGGALATNASGPRRLVAGTVRDLLIGVTFVRADGVVARAGGKVVKNVAGYDVGKLLVGSFGTLAVVTEATFRLHPVPPATRWLTAHVASPADAQRLVQSILGAQVVPAAIGVAFSPAGASLSLLLEGRADGVDARVEAARELLPGSAVSDTGPDGWGTYPWDLSATGDDRAVALKLTFRLSGLADVLAATDGFRVTGSAGAGVLYAAVPGEDPAWVAATVARLRAVCAGHGGSVVVVDAPAAVKQAVDVWGPVPGLDLMRRVKDEFDPDHRLAPGRFVGGI
ncbi:FAD-binding oxidoreductase [Nocardioides sp. CER19]|uniref:FAD-binding oxidoreductase n=1 Tax=Nocardioides sp. CER19 TaxID=3038538 RepID=UPI00244729A6|nr:FAD-binding oxidoreductase [Nocardioides sp. CER19]MDH2414488.1 FAD-binding oxidoreductase [Nocardioides sp. CER19]